MAKHRRMAHEPLASDRVAPAAEVTRKMASLRGQSRSDLERDDTRGAMSPLGKGSHSKSGKRR